MVMYHMQLSLDFFRSPITLYRKSKDENTYRVCKELSVGGQSAVENNTEQPTVTLENCVENCQSPGTAGSSVGQPAVGPSKPGEQNCTFNFDHEVSVRCGQSTCKFLIKIYCISKSS
jgi:hypothetical protein